MEREAGLAAESAQEFERAAVGRREECATLQSRSKTEGRRLSMERSKVTEQLDKWTNLLGLEVVPCSRGFVIAFTNLSQVRQARLYPTCNASVLQTDPARRFSCQLEVGEDRSYRVVRVEPPVDPIQNMVDLLNLTNDLSGFVVNLRETFLNLAEVPQFLK